MPDITMRPLRPDDFERGFLATLECLTRVGLTADEARTVYAELPPQSHVHVAEIAGRVIGTATLLVERKFIHAGGWVGHIEDVAVHSEAQRQGIGTKLVGHLVEEARKLGCYKVILDCFPNLAPFYARLGFREFNAGLRIDL